MKIKVKIIEHLNIQDNFHQEKMVDQERHIQKSILQNNILWFVKDGSVVLESDFVSGKESDSTRLTPSGTYYIYNKERNRVLRGTKQPNGKYEYESPVSYWMPFNKGIGLHDASWRSTFGRDIYINSGSHGCINLPTGFAGSLYSQIYVNLPVVVYR